MDVSVPPFTEYLFSSSRVFYQNLIALIYETNTTIFAGYNLLFSLLD